MENATKIQTTAEGKNVYIVLGMARSGTSAITRCFNVLGIALGDHLINRNENWNPKGVWEDSDIVYKVNRKASFILDYHWMQDDLMAAERQYAALRDLRAYAVSLVNDRLSTLPNWGFKDPRMVKLLPMWNEVFQETKVRDHYVIAVRHPLAVAHSNLTFSKIDLEISMIEWLQTAVAMIEGTQGKPRLIVTYERMLENPRKELERIQAAFKSLDPINQSEADIYINEFLDKNLHHHAYQENDLKTHRAALIVTLVQQVYQLFTKVACDELSLESAAFTSEWCLIKQEYARQRVIHEYIESLHKKNKQLTRELRMIRHSIPWKLIYPLRVVDNMLHARRQKKHAVRR